VASDPSAEPPTKSMLAAHQWRSTGNNHSAHAVRYDSSWAQWLCGDRSLDRNGAASQP
jgi:hypothetical protein